MFICLDVNAVIAVPKKFNPEMRELPKVFLKQAIPLSYMSFLFVNDFQNADFFHMENVYASSQS